MDCSIMLKSHWKQYICFVGWDEKLDATCMLHWSPRFKHHEHSHEAVFRSWVTGSVYHQGDVDQEDRGQKHNNIHNHLMGCFNYVLLPINVASANKLFCQQSSCLSCPAAEYWVQASSCCPNAHKAHVQGEVKTLRVILMLRLSMPLLLLLLTFPISHVITDHQARCPHARCAQFVALDYQWSNAAWGAHQVPLVGPIGVGFRWQLRARGRQCQSLQMDGFREDNDIVVISSSM